MQHSPLSFVTLVLCHSEVVQDVSSDQTNSPPPPHMQETLASQPRM